MLHTSPTPCNLTPSGITTKKALATSDSKNSVKRHLLTYLCLSIQATLTAEQIAG
jgi:hypothetical protein